MKQTMVIVRSMVRDMMCSRNYNCNHATRTIIDERESLWDLLGGIHGMVIADIGLIGADDQMNCVDVQISSY